MAVGFSPLHQSEYALALFPKARARVAVDDLPNFAIYVEVPPQNAQPTGPSPFQQPADSFNLSPTYPTPRSPSGYPSGTPPR